MIETKAIISDIKHFAVHDGDGIRTTVFFKGCPLRCLWCHNPEGIKGRPEMAFYASKCISCGACVEACHSGAQSMRNGEHFFDRDKCILCGECSKRCLGEAMMLYGRSVTVDELIPILLEDKEFYENSGGGVTLSGGECLIYSGFCAELLRRLKDNGINTAVDTCGYVSRENIDRVIPYTDTFLYDIKAYDDSLHKALTGVSNERILENLKYLDAMGKSVEIRIPYIPELNSGEIGAIAEFLFSLSCVTGIRVLPYHSYAGSKYSALDMQNTLPERLPDDFEMIAARETLRRVTGKLVYS